MSRPRKGKGRQPPSAPAADAPPAAPPIETPEAAAPPTPVSPDRAVRRPVRPARATALPPSAELEASLRDVLHDAEQHRVETELALAPAPTTVSNGWLAAAFASWLLFAALLLFRPAFVRGPAPAPFTPSAAERDPSLRYGLWLARRQIDRFRTREGRLPSFLGETGFRDTTITMDVTGESTFVLIGRDHDLTLRLASAMAADSFLGRSPF